MQNIFLAPDKKVAAFTIMILYKCVRWIMVHREAIVRCVTGFTEADLIDAAN
jgi:hypothetical protein